MALIKCTLCRNFKQGQITFVHLTTAYQDMLRTLIISGATLKEELKHYNAV